MSANNAEVPSSDWPLVKDRWLGALTGPGGDNNAGQPSEPVLELRDEARALLHRHGDAAGASQYFEVHLAHG